MSEIAVEIRVTGWVQGVGFRWSCQREAERHRVRGWVRNGVGREQAHEAIKEHAVAVALGMREQGSTDNDLFDRLAADPRLGLSREQLDALVADPTSFTGAAGAQVATVVERVEAVVARFPGAASYVPGPIL